MYFLIISAFSAPFDDFVAIKISGYEDHKWYSGIPFNYLGYLLLLADTEDGAYHYVFFESQRDPLGDPVVLC